MIPSRAARVDRECDERPVQLAPACSRRFAIAGTPRRSAGFPGAVGTMHRLDLAGVVDHGGGNRISFGLAFRNRRRQFAGNRQRDGFLGARLLRLRGADSHSS